MSRRCATFLVLLSLVGCTTRHQPEPISLHTSPAVIPDRGRTVAVTGQALRPGTLRMEHAAAAMEIDSSDYANALATGVASALRSSGFSVADDAEDQLRVTFDYATLVPGAWKVVCYVDVTAETSSGVRRGFQGRGESSDPKQACQQALTDGGSQILSAAELRPFLNGDDEEPAPSAAEQSPDDPASSTE